MDWYYADGGRQVGPLGEDDFRRLVDEGRVRSSTLVWHEGMAGWQPLGEVASQLTAAPGGEGRPAPGVRDFCSQCGRQFSTDDMISYESVWVCADCKELFFQRIGEGGPVAPAGDAFTYAGFWIRFAAVMIDGIILWVGQKLLVMGLGAMLGALGIVSPIMIVIVIMQYIVNIAYVVFFLGRFGATPGKMAVGIKVIVSNGRPIGYLRALGRYLAKILSGIIFAIGYIMAAFDDEKRALHDHICNTRVIYK